MHYVKCLYCNRTFDADTEEYVKPNSNRYAHKACYDVYLQNEKDKEELIDYITQLFELKSPGPVIYKQLKTFRSDPAYGYSNKGILNALKYFYEVKKGNKEKANAQLGIVPYIYDEAQKYYENIERANKVNQQVLNNGFKYNIEVDTVTIPSPQRNVRKRNLFSFLDEEVTDGE